MTIILVILGILGGLVWSFSRPVGAFMILLGIAGTLMIYYSDRQRDHRHEVLFAAHSAVLVKSGLGNTYTEAAMRELDATGDLASVEDHLRSALDLNPNDRRARYILGTLIITDVSLSAWRSQGRSVKHHHKRIQEASALAQRGLEVDPRAGEFYEILGMCDDTEGKHEEARGAFERFHQLTGNPRAFVREGVSWLQSGNAEDALTSLQTAISEGAVGWDVSLQYGRALLFTNHFRESVEQLRRSLQEAPDRTEPLSALADAAWNDGLPLEAARADWTTGLLLLGHGCIRTGIRRILDSFGKRLIGSVCTLSKRANRTVPKRMRWLRRIALFLAPPDEPEFTIAFANFEQGHYEAAERLFRKAAQAVPGRAATWSNLAASLALQQKREEALEAIDRALELEPGHPEYEHNREAFFAGPVTGKSGVILVPEAHSSDGSDSSSFRD